MYKFYYYNLYYTVLKISFIFMSTVLTISQVIFISHATDFFILFMMQYDVRH